MNRDRTRSAMSNGTGLQLRQRRRAAAGLLLTVAIGLFATLLFWRASVNAQMPRDHNGHGACAEPTLACASSATPAFDRDGTLWLAWVAGGRVMVAHSLDLGRTFLSAVSVNAQPLRLDSGPDARPNIIIDSQGGVAVAYAVFKDDAYNGQGFLARSVDGVAAFSPPRPLTSDPASQRFQALALDADGSLFAAWLDKRNGVAAKNAGQEYAGAALAFAWANEGGTIFSTARIAHDHACECCKLGVAFAARGRPVVLFRNIFEGSVRDHAITTFVDPLSPGPIYRVSVDDWQVNACPHQGPSLAISPSGRYHAAWFTDGRVRRGLYYARSANGGQGFSAPMPIGTPGARSSRPHAMALSGTVWLAWKEFDGKQTTANVIRSNDDGATWTAPHVLAGTESRSDHPLLVNDGQRAYVSWLTGAEGYRLFPLECPL
jgi:hypothetical protein